MSTIDLMLLGALIRKDASAYEIKKAMEMREIQYWVKISSPSIFKNLVALHKKGYIDGHAVREGEMPEKTVYSVNEKGRAYFMELMVKYAGDPGMVYMDFTAFVANLHLVDRETGLALISELKEKMAGVKEEMRIKTKRKKEFIPYHAVSLMELYYKMYALFYDWTEQLYADYSRNTPK